MYSADIILSLVGTETSGSATSLFQHRVNEMKSAVMNIAYYPLFQDSLYSGYLSMA